MATLTLNRNLRLVEFIIAKTKFHDFFKHKLNELQLKTAERMFQEGQDGFQRELSLSNYLNVTKTSRATATRDLLGLVAMGAFKKTEELKGTWYFLNLETFSFVTYPYFF